MALEMLGLQSTWKDHCAAWYQYAQYICHATYWTRVWTAQETMLAKFLTVQLGSIRVRAEALELLLSRIYHRVSLVYRGRV